MSGKDIDIMSDLKLEHSLPVLDLCIPQPSRAGVPFPYFQITMYVLSSTLLK